MSDFKVFEFKKIMVSVVSLSFIGVASVLAPSYAFLWLEFGDQWMILVSIGLFSVVAWSVTKGILALFKKGFVDFVVFSIFPVLIIITVLFGANVLGT